MERRALGSRGAPGDAGTSPHPRIGPASRRTSRGWGPAVRGEPMKSPRALTRELLPNQKLERAEMAVGEVLEPAPAGGDGGLGAVEAGDRAKQVLVVLAQLQLDGAGERRIAGQLQRRPVAVAAGVDQRAEAQALQPLGDGAAVPAELAGARLHVKAVTPQGREHGGVARLAAGLRGGATLRLGQAQVPAL